MAKTEFAPILGEVDLYLFGEGRHEEIYKKLGAHVTKIGDVGASRCGRQRSW